MNTPMAIAIVLVLVAALVLWARGGFLGGGGAETRLLRICRGNEQQAERLIAAELSRSPGISRNEAAARAIQRYERDNR